jgi:hypothetical protein
MVISRALHRELRASVPRVPSLLLTPMPAKLTLPKSARYDPLAGPPPVSSATTSAEASRQLRPRGQAAETLMSARPVRLSVSDSR